MRPFKTLLGAALAVALVPATASAAGVDGTYNGVSDEGQEITIVISGGKPTAITGATVHRLECTRIEPTQAPPNDLQPRPDKTGNFPIDTSDRGGEPGKQFFIGSPESTPTTGDHVFTSGDGTFTRNFDGRSLIKFRMSYEETSESGQDGRQTRCTGNAEAELVVPIVSKGKTKLRRPGNLRGKLTANVPPLASLGDEGIKIFPKTSRPAAGGTIAVSVRRDPDARDKLRFGNGTLGRASRKVDARGRTRNFTVQMKSPLRTPSKGDKVPMLVTVEFTDRRGRTRSATTKIVVK
jgi:hypothetical protein